MIAEKSEYLRTVFLHHFLFAIKLYGKEGKNMKVKVEIQESHSYEDSCSGGQLRPGKGNKNDEC